MIVLAVALAVTQVTYTEDPIERRFEVGSAEAAEIYVRNEDGRTELTSHDAARVEVRVTKEVLRARSDEEAKRYADEVEVRIEERNGRIEVDTRHPDQFWSFKRRPRVLVHIAIRAPRRSNLDVATEDGPLVVDGFEGSHRLRSEDGDVRVAGCSGAVDIMAEDGDVDLTDFDGEVRANVEDGDLGIDGTFRDLNAESEDGRVEIHVRPGSTMAGDWSVRASDGRIRVTLPEDFSAELDLRTDDGSIDIDPPVAIRGKYAKNKLTGTLNDGGHTLRVRADDGSIRITSG